MKNLLATFTLLTIALNSFAQNQISYEKGKLFQENQLVIDKFYFVHQTFADAFYMTDLYKQLSDDEMYAILHNAYYSVTKDEKVLVMIEQPSGPPARLAFNFMGNTEKLGDILVLATNFNKKSRVFEEKVDSEESIYRWYKIDHGKLVYRKDLYSKKAEMENRESNSYSLIGMYLFDDNFENDDKVKPLLDELLASNKEDIEKLYGYLYLGEYWLLQNDLIKAEAALEELKELLKNSESIPKGYSLIANMATTELAMMKRFNN
ncbi:hypothetical protein [Aequorivita sp. CIP111184]|uniref:hypothetical protein n=1 Tax=Aequorivita sp. CIP111184 TaxID=2211356 RepID=UPI000DBC36DD|nr:hypothetical protein [Aequorivita sp. CIP111184]SRX56132.1 hypothetical protein AEQU1_03159 [Aequorivita sp. CIP111184]